MVLVLDAAVAGLGHDPFGLAAQPVRLGIQRRLETQRLPAVVGSFLEVGVSPLRRVAQEDDDAHVGKIAGQALRRERMEKVVGARIPGDRGPDTGPGEVAAAGLEREV